MFSKIMFLALVSMLVFSLTACALTHTLQIKGSSMEPTIRDGERISVDRSAFKNTSPKREDIIVYEYQGGQRISRIIGLPLEAITIKDGGVFVNGNKLDEPYLAAGTRTESSTTEFTVPAGSFFLLCDNRERSSDSRAIGFIPADKIIAKVLK